MPTLTAECDQPERLLDITAAAAAISAGAECSHHAFALGICGRTGCGHTLASLALDGSAEDAVFTVPDFEAPPTPNQLREMQEALNELVEDPAFRHKIVVLPPGRLGRPVLALIEVHRDGTVTWYGNHAPVIEDGWLIGFDTAHECAHELVLMPVVESALTYRCRKCPADWRVPIDNSNAGKSIETISHETAAEAEGTYVGPFVYRGTEPHPGTYSNI